MSIIATREEAYNQYILTLENDGDWYRAVQDDPMDFYEITKKVIRKYSFKNGDSFHFNTWQYILVYLWVNTMEGSWASFRGYFLTFYSQGTQDKYKALFDELQPVKKVKPQVLTVPPKHVISYNVLSTFPLQQENQTMSQLSNTTPVQTVHYVYGQDVETVTEEQLISSIKKLEKEITDLASVKAKSKKITAKIESAQKAIDVLVGYLDNK